MKALREEKCFKCRSQQIMYRITRVRSLYVCSLYLTCSHKHTGMTGNSFTGTHTQYQHHVVVYKVSGKKKTALENQNSFFLTVGSSTHNITNTNQYFTVVISHLFNPGWEVSTCGRYLMHLRLCVNNLELYKYQTINALQYFAWFK